MKLCECGCGNPAPLAVATVRGYKKGQPQRFILGHYRKARTTYYKQIGRNTLLHRLRAERALGKPLPVGAVVHHADGSRGDDAPLVICQNSAYHNALHARMRIKAAGGNPWTDKICALCRVVKPLEAFSVNSRQFNGRYQYCKDCDNNRRRANMAALQAQQQPEQPEPQGAV